MGFSYGLHGLIPCLFECSEKQCDGNPWPEPNILYISSYPIATRYAIKSVLSPKDERACNSETSNKYE